MMQHIKRVSFNLFKVKVNSSFYLELDFTNLVELAKTQTEKPFVLEHWQAPTGLWGYYQSINDSYYSSVWDKVTFSENLNCSNIQVEKKHKNHKPTACKIYYNSMLIVDSGQIIVIKKLPD